jgi:Phytanoyl-CoA dioxygenase (PhyH)
MAAAPWRVAAAPKKREDGPSAAILEGAMAVTREMIFDPGFWRALAPGFHIADSAFLRPDNHPPDVSETDGLGPDGYIQLKHLDLGADFGAMANAARAISATGLDAVFAFVYDEFWRPFFRLDPLFRTLLGGPYTFLPDLWTWNVDHTKGQAGWKPHRDRGRQALFEDGRPKSLTTWIAISESTPLNGCIYMVPASEDPTYAREDEAHWKFDHASIRALPCAPGDVLVWNQAVVHWGAKSSPRAAETRVSMSFETQRLDVPSSEAPLIAPWEILPFEARLRLIAQKILHYRHISSVEKANLQLAYQILN